VKRLVRLIEFKYLKYKQNYKSTFMTEKELSEILADMYNNSLKGESVAMIHLFGIKYSEQIKEYGIKEIVERSGLNASYATEVSKGIKLAKYVIVR